ncbi:MAG: DNA ligase D [Planctomycetota bacterium]
MGLRDYHRKRDFTRTQEPRGGEPPTTSGNTFVIQKHAARRLHYDFRLELDGVLKSWALPRGPSLDPAEKRLAVHVEDHPLEYAFFEGVIPKGEYGGGTVLLWDRGIWLPKGDAADGYRRGNLKFTLAGQKLRGAFALVRMKPRADERRRQRAADEEDGENWLLIKELDQEVRRGKDDDVLERLASSALSGRTMEEIAREPDRVWHSLPKNPAPVFTAAAIASLKNVVRAEPPEQITPQLATPVATPPEGDQWLHEIKLDGYRLIARAAGGKVRVFTRHGLDWTDRFPSIVRILESLPVAAAILDGEVVKLQADGRSSFDGLQDAIARRSDAGLTYFVFDLLHLDGFDLRQVPLEQRKQTLKPLLERLAYAANVRYTDHVVGRGKEFFLQAGRFRLEGVVSKLRDGAYRGVRSRDWLKAKCEHRQEFVVGGFTEPAGSRAGFGALLLGYYDAAGQLIYAGRVGTGFTDRDLEQLRTLLGRHEQAQTPFAALPRDAVAPGTHWVAPELVAEVRFTSWTEARQLRHAAFLGLREDKRAREVTSELPAPRAEPPRPDTIRAESARVSRSVEVAGIKISNPDKVLYPDIGVTKLELAHFYTDIADWILPHLVRRPLTVVRCPDGYLQENFYQKHMNDTVSDALRTIPVHEDGKVVNYLMIDSLAGLIGCVQMAVLELHTWGTHMEHLDRPDQLIFDLDPDTALPFSAVIAAASTLRALLTALELTSFVKTTGGKGLHVVVPIDPELGWSEVKAFSKAVADALVRIEPRRYTATSAKAERTGKIFVDYLRNAEGATAVAAYSTRARAGAPVATPIHWDELDEHFDPRLWHVRSLGARLAQLAGDPWQGYAATRQSLGAAIRKLR